MLGLQKITISRGNKTLLKDSSTVLYEKQKVGLIGNNGCGKSSLFSLILGELSLDQGEFSLSSNVRIAHLSQQLPDSSGSALDFVLAGDETYFALREQLKTAEKQQDNDKILHYHERMAEIGGYSKPALAATIMAGLGFSTEEQNNSVNHFSGGWRMRLSLARCLMNPADLILLDEPTNHLDMEAIFWLEKWLKQNPATILVISHDREFLDAFVTHILHIEHQSLFLYRGNYSHFEQTRAQKLALQQATYKKQQQKVHHLMSFVNRFRAKATKAKQAQSRLKYIEKMDIVAQAQIDSPFTFSFYPAPRATTALVRCKEIDAGYNSTPILRNINFIVQPGDRIALLGPNGEGKSTLVKTLVGLIPPLHNTITYSQSLRIGYYAQHQLEELDNNLSPLQTIQALSPDAKEQTIRDFLGGFNFTSDITLHSIQHFSGGEKARLALAKLVWQKPNLLLLDEPTNHLDLNMRTAIEIALQSYEGALIIISHDRHMLRTCVNDFYLIYQQKVQPFTGDLDDYHYWLSNKETSNNASQAPNNTTYCRDRKVLQNRLKKLETMLAQYHQKETKLQTTLADPTLYEEKDNIKLTRLLAEQKTLQQKLKIVEEEWLEVSEQLE